MTYPTVVTVITLHQQPDIIELNLVPFVLVVFSTVYMILPNISTTMNTWNIAVALDIHYSIRGFGFLNRLPTCILILFRVF